ncbi:hypothetical protein B484DRAFT_13492, partial [Ochromonadaceae sp. CCMP2298]
MAPNNKEAKSQDRKSKKSDKNRHEPDSSDDANRLSSKEGTPVVSAEKSGGKKRKAKSDVEHAIRKKPANPFLAESEGPDISGKKPESQEHESSDESDSGDRDDGHADPDFNGQDYGLPVHATRADLNELLKQGRGYDALAEQLRQLQAANQSKSSNSNQTVIVSDMNSYHITSERINAVGFTKLREKCEAEKRNGRTIDRNLLITADAQKLIGQMLGAKKVPDFANWKVWTDLQFFESLSKICPAGKTLQIRHLQDYLSKTRCDMFLDTHPTSSLTFVAEINEGTRIYADELKLATERGCIDSVQREAVATLL